MRRPAALAIAVLGSCVAFGGSARSQEQATPIQGVRSLIDKGLYAEAEAAARERVAQVESTEGPEALATGEALDLLVEALWRRGKASQPESLALAERAVAIKEKAPRVSRLSLATSLFHLGAYRSEAGDFDQAKRLLERALEIRQAVQGPDHPDVGYTLNVLGVMHRKAGDVIEARRLIEQGLAIRENALGRDHLLVAGSLNDLASVLFDLHDFAAVGPILERAVDIWEKNLGPDHPRVGLGLSNLATLRVQTSGDYAGARPLFERALAIQEKSLGPAHPSVALTLSNLGQAIAETGDRAAAKPLLERSLAIREKALGPEHASVAESLNALATLLSELGEYAAAEPLYDRALAIAEKLAGSRHALTAATLLNLAVLRAHTGKTDEALADALRVEDIERAEVRLVSRALSEREALAHAAGRPPALALALTLVAERRNPSAAVNRAVWDAVVRSRSLVLDEMASRHRSISGAEDPETKRLMGEVASTREALAKLLVRGPRNEPPGQYRELLDSARQEQERAERALAARSGAFRAEQARDNLGLDEVIAGLPPGSVLVAFASYDRRPLSQTRSSGTPQEAVPSYIAFVFDSNTGNTASIPIGTVAEVDRLVADVRKSTEQAATYAASGRPETARYEAAYRTAGNALRKRIWEPLQLPSVGPRRVFVVPDGALNFVNLAALPTGTDRYLIETGLVLHLVSAERDLVAREGARTGLGLLALGAPAFDDESTFAALTSARPVGARETAARTYRGGHPACGSFAAMWFEALPAADREVQELGKLWGDFARSVIDPAVTLGAAAVLTGASASEAALKRDAAGHRILHLATHGFFLGGRCASALDRAAPVGRAAEAGGENPLLLAGLALAGANHRGVVRAEEEDGILTAEEIAALDLDGVEWAVLSACDTGVGEVKASEGVFGLRRAFLMAGSKAVVMSLWPVEDSSTREWMTALYRNRLARKLDTAEAVREASLGVLHRRREQRQSTHPFFWAGFVATGDWR